MNKANLLPRIIAKVIDLLIVIGVAMILPLLIGPLLGFFYSILADGNHYGNFSGQSVGKKLMGLQVRNTVQNRPASFKDSMIRNSPVGLATFFAVIPIWGWVILFLIGIPLMAIEIYLMVRVESGHRLGDVMADTEVVPVREGVAALKPEKREGGGQ